MIKVKKERGPGQMMVGSARENWNTWNRIPPKRREQKNKKTNNKKREGARKSCWGLR